MKSGAAKDAGTAAVSVLVFCGSRFVCRASDAGQALAVSPLGLLQFLVAPGSLQRLGSLPCLLTLLIAALLPALLVVRGSIRRIPFGASVVTNAIVLVAVYAILTMASGVFGHSIASVLSVLPLLGG